MSCADCASWVRKRKKVYDDGTEVVSFDGEFCDLLAIKTTADFGCQKFTQMADGWDHTVIERVDGAPWQRFKMGACPDCAGRGSGVGAGACYRCAGSGLVRFYDDGYVGEERTRKHPKEPQAGAQIDPGTILAPIEKVSVLDSPSA